MVNLYTVLPLYLICTMSSVWVRSQIIRKCEAIDACSCRYPDDGSVIDITSLGNTDGTARFTDAQSKDGSMYSYNPCHPFSEGDGCQDVAVCQNDQSLGKTLNVGNAATPQFTYDNQTGATVLGYTSNTSGVYHSTFVYLMCDNSVNPGPPHFSANGRQDNPNIFALTLSSVCACGNMCDANGVIEAKPAVALGTWLLIGVCTVCVLYWVLGASYMKFVKKASGKEIIPNISFWTSIPRSITAGVMFLGRGCKRDSSYDPVPSGTAEDKNLI